MFGKIDGLKTMARKYDLIVVGSGPAGAMAGKTAAEKGLKVLMLERAKSPGDKNTSGSSVFFLKELWGWMREGPIQREIWGADFGFIFDDEVGLVRFPLKGRHQFLDVYRNEWDSWVAQNAVEAGAELKTSTLVTDVIKDENGVVKGVTTDKGERIEAPMTLGCDGVNSVVARRAGLRGKWRTHEIAAAVKYDYALSSEKIKDRFGGQEDGKVCFQFWFSPEWSAGEGSYAWIFPNKDSISVAIGVIPSDIEHNPEYYLNKFMTHPAIRPYLKGAQKRNRTTHLIPLGGPVRPGVKTYTDGCMICGDAGGFVSPVHGGGIMGAYRTAMLAVDIATDAISSGDVSSENLKVYEAKWLKEAEPVGPVQGASKEMLEFTKWFYEEVGLETWGRLLMGFPKAVFGGPLYLARFFSTQLLPTLPKIARALHWVSKPLVDLFLSLMPKR